MKNRRKFDRLEIAKEAAVLIGASKTFLPCVALDISRKGAKIAMSRPYALPKRMLLSFDNFETARSSQTIWTKGNLVGIEFVEAT